jgi:hypothetical protein
MSEDSLFKQIHDCNLVTYYLLPLLEINKFKFGEDNFVNAFVDSTGTHIFVEVKDPTEMEEPFHVQWFKTTAIHDNRRFIVYELPERWQDTFELFKQGKYSQFSRLAKATIFQHSGLRWKFPSVNAEGRATELSDARLLALKREVSLRDAMALEFNVESTLMANRELIDPPKESEFLRVVL